MKLLHTSDWHLGIKLHNISLLSDQLFFAQELYKIIANESVEAVLISGDIFDSSVSGADAIELYNNIVTHICAQMSVAVIAIAGNHDGASRLASCRELLKNSGLYITGRVTAKMQPIIFGDVAIYSIPFFNTDEVRALYPDKPIKSCEQAMAVLCDEIREDMDKTRRNILLAHAFVSSAELSESDRSAFIGSASMMSKDVFKGFDYVALGHLHKAQSIANTRYSGSPIKYSASEAKADKSVTILDTSDMSLREITLSPLHQMRVIKGAYADILNNVEYNEDYIKVEITDQMLTLEAMGVLRAMYPNMFSLSGKSTGEQGGEVSLSPNEVKALSASEILQHFFAEALQITPTDEQAKAFEEALESALSEGDLS